MIPVNRLIPLVAFAVLGCGEKDPNPIEKQPTTPAHGTVTYKNAPLNAATVSFLSIDGKVRAHGTTDNAGKFVLSTYGKEDGAPVGKYKVVVATSNVQEIEPGVLAPEPVGGFKSLIPTKYSNPDTTDILLEVTAGGKNEFTIELK
ncbi:MAG: carboxypeptidase regulatory-like domain-containing protein [Planctomycetaceae bacterium]|nr:carboxypeptidase regulatory-like domain-containing protein [Planctomycetaceae bacterium]